MSTTPITFERKQLEYTLTGGQDEGAPRRAGLSILLLNRGDKPFRRELLQQLSQLGTREIISVETSQNQLDSEELQKEMPLVKQLFFQSDASWGERINIGIREAQGEFVFVLWNDTNINSNSISSRVFSKIEERQIFCTLPLLFDKEDELYPSRFIPGQDKGNELKMFPMLPVEGEPHCLFPYDYTGIYHRNKFLYSGGFDGNIKNPYWQLMDLGFRAAMGGEQILFNFALKIHYQVEVPTLDITADKDYILFFLKTLAIKIRKGKAYLPHKNGFGLWIRSDLRLKDAFAVLRRVRQWVKSNQYSINFEASEVMSKWGGL